MRELTKKELEYLKNSEQFEKLKYKSENDLYEGYKLYLNEVNEPLELSLRNGERKKWRIGDVFEELDFRFFNKYYREYLSERLANEELIEIGDDKYYEADEIEEILEDME